MISTDARRGVKPGVTYEPDVWGCIDRHKKARSEHGPLHTSTRTAFDALCKVKVRNTREAAAQLGYVCSTLEEAPTLPPGDRDGFKLSALADRLLEISEEPQPTKRVPALWRGRKLTRAGQLFRYHAFLVNELMTVSWELYGSRDYASRMIPMDGYVQRAVGPRRGFAPFHDPRTLRRRAVAVMRSLKIDSTTADNLATRRTKATAKAVQS